MVAYRMAYGFSTPPARSLLSVEWLRRLRVLREELRGYGEGICRRSPRVCQWGLGTGISRDVSIVICSRRRISVSLGWGKG